MRAYPTIPVTKPLVALLCTSLIMGLVGCALSHQMSLAHDVLATPQQRFSDHIVMQRQAEDRREVPGRIGHKTATLFAIESGSVETTNPVGIEIAMQVKEALESVGYQITLAEAPYSDPLPTNILKVQINEFYFKNYSWFAPLFFTWGNIALTLTLENHEGKVVFARTFQQKGDSNRPFEGGFDVAIKEAMTEILNQIVKVSSTEEFRQVLKS
jgi:hypothetical protein